MFFTVRQFAAGCDPDSWTIRNASHQRTWRASAYGNEVFIIVSNAGTGNRINRSTNGTTFSAISAAGAAEWEGVCFGEYSGGDRFVACSTDTVSDQRFQYSTDDGASWTLATTSITSEQWADVTFDDTNDTFIACASGTNNAFVARSTNGGVDWTSASYGITQQPFYGIHANAGTTIMVGRDGKILRSTDGGSNWSDVSPGGSYTRRLKSVTSGGGVWVAVADLNGGGAGKLVLASTDDGATWTEYDSATQKNWEDVTFGDGVFLACSANNISPTTNEEIMVSLDLGQTWTEHSLSTSADTSDDWTSAAYGTFSGVGIFMVAGTASGMGVGELGQIQTSIC